MDLNRFIDHTLLKVDSTNSDVERLCAEAIEHDFYSVCIAPHFVPLAKSLIADSNVKLATVVGFPFGYQSTEVKLNEIIIASDLGADEVDVVWNVAAFKSNDLAILENELKVLKEKSHQLQLKIKVIIESGLLNENELKQAAALSISSQPDFIKTSTGFNGIGAEIEKVTLLRKWLPATMAIKASGGIKTKKQALAYIEAGATRLGTSGSIKIIKGE